MSSNQRQPTAGSFQIQGDAAASGSMWVLRLWASRAHLPMHAPFLHQRGVKTPLLCLPSTGGWVCSFATSLLPLSFASHFISLWLRLSLLVPGLLMLGPSCRIPAWFFRASKNRHSQNGSVHKDLFLQQVGFHGEEKVQGSQAQAGFQGFGALGQLPRMSSHWLSS